MVLILRMLGNSLMIVGITLMNMVTWCMINGLVTTTLNQTGKWQKMNGLVSSTLIKMEFGFQVNLLKNGKKILPVNGIN